LHVGDVRGVAHRTVTDGLPEPGDTGLDREHRRKVQPTPMIEPPRHSQNRTDRESCATLRVFIVENHEETRSLLCLLIESLGHRVWAVESMHEALLALDLNDYDVLISDIGLADGDGWELMRRLGRARPRYAVALSGFGMTADRVRSRAVGFRHHLVKPQGIENLPAVLREAARECRQPLSRPEHSLQH